MKPLFSPFFRMSCVIPKLSKQVSKLGFGSYRLSNQHKALKEAIQGGINIIDTSHQFEQGLSETCIGNTLKTLNTPRESVTLISKAGYMAPDERHQFQAHEYVQLNEKSFHSIHPRVLAYQLKTSLERLQTDTLDIFMLNAPERLLMSYSRPQLYKEMNASFSYLDSLVSDGVIRGYGVCSNSMALPDAVDHISFNDVMNACDKKDHFVAIQVPFNLFEHEVVLSDKPTLSTQAKEQGVYLTTNRPLNAIAHGQIRVLVNHVLGSHGIGQNEHQIMSDMASQFDKVAKMETDMVSELPMEESLASKFVWSQVLSENLSRLSQNHFATRYYLQHQVLPAIEKDLVELHHYAQSANERADIYTSWISDYQQSMRELIEFVVSYAYIDTLRKNNDLDRILSALCPSLNQCPPDAHSPLTIKLLRFYLSQVDTVFTGMRDPVYVKDALVAAQLPPLDQDAIDSVWQCPLF
ncbi:NADP-dependent oxidoreductase domain-containing protein [Pilobolus umbonatus]|nr:NADP-dependent oxidoreductase domain-containing protein [Pilobolus umbonatus]